MNELFDPLILIPAIIAAVVLYRLYTTLGQKTGSEDPPPVRPTAPRRDDAPRDDNVVPLRGARAAGDTAPEGQAEPGDALAIALRDIVSADRSFDAASFIEGAGAAYEMIVTAFAQGDRKTLKPLLSREVFEGFSGAIDERARLGQTVSLTFVGLDKADIVEAGVQNRTARIKVKFVSQLITVTRDREGNVVDGDPGKVVTVTDGWTFERPVTSSDPNWFLVATETLE